MHRRPEVGAPSIQGNSSVEIDVRYGDRGTSVEVVRIQPSGNNNRCARPVDIIPAEFEGVAVDEYVLVDDEVDEGVFCNPDVTRFRKAGRTVGVACVQGDGVVAGARVGVDGVLFGGGVAIAEVPEPGGDVAGALV